MDVFSLNLDDLGNSIAGYVTDISTNPLKLVVFILDVLIVGYIIYKFIKSARSSRV